MHNQHPYSAFKFFYALPFTELKIHNQMICLIQDAKVYLWLSAKVCAAEVARQHHHEDESCKVKEQYSV